MNTARYLRLTKITAIGVAALLILYTGISVYGAIATMGAPRLPLTETPSSVGLAYEDVSFTSRDDNVVLRGWYIPSQRDTVIIIVHGGYQNRIDDNVDTLSLARDLVKKGYDLLLFDLRGRGESEGEGSILSNGERDIGGAVDYLESRGYFLKNICIIGFCSGAAMACLFASQNNIGALVLDGCFANAHDAFVGQLVLTGIPEFIVRFFRPGISLMRGIIYNDDPVNPVDVIADVPCPILFIHEENDVVVTSEEMHHLFRVSSNPANEFWEVSDADHSQSYKTSPAAYVEKVDLFLLNRVKD